VFYAEYPVILEIAPEERVKALRWLVSTHPRLDYLLEEEDDDSAELRVRPEDASVLDALADMLERE